MGIWLFVKTLTSVSAAFFSLLSFSWTRKAHGKLIFEVTKEEEPRPLNPDPTTGFDDNRAEGGEFSADLGSGHMTIQEAGGPEVSMGAQLHPPAKSGCCGDTQIRSEAKRCFQAGT